MTAPTTATSRPGRGLWILIAILGVSGVVMAFLAVFGSFDSFTGGMVWRILVADLYLIASLLAQHTWLRRAAWVATGLTFVFGVVNELWPLTPWYQWADGRSTMEYGDPSSGWSPWFGFEGDLELAGHIIVIGLLVLGFISRAWRWIREERLLRIIYAATFATGLSAVALGAISALDSDDRWNIARLFEQVGPALLILSLTAAAIITIAGFVQRRAAISQSRAAEGAPLGSIAGMEHPTGIPDEMKALVRHYVDEYLAEKRTEEENPTRSTRTPNEPAQRTEAPWPTEF